MSIAKLLPTFLVEKYRGWKSTEFEESSAWYKKLADEGQNPPAMVISCCDSRVNVTSIFGEGPGELFVHRNIANLVPPAGADQSHRATPAAIEYAVKYLKVSHIIVIGHSSCGGVQGCYDMCSGNAPEFEEDTSYIGRWIDALRPGFEKIHDANADRQKQLTAFEKEAVVLSLSNLVTYPFVKDAVDAGTLNLHGLWINIGSGQLETYDPESKTYKKV